MARILKIKNAEVKGTTIQHALIETLSKFQVVRWTEATNEKELIDEIEFEGNADRRAARAMAFGCLDSLHQLARMGA